MARKGTKITYALDGATREFQIPYEYLSRKFIQVTLKGPSSDQLLTLNVDYRFVRPGVVLLNRAWGLADGFMFVELNRYTSATERLVDFNDGSILRAYDLNISQVQAIHIAEEGRNIAETSLILNGLNWDALNRRIINLADPIDDKDAANKGWTENRLAALISQISGSSNIAGNVVMSGFDGKPHTVQEIASAIGSTLLGHKNSREGSVERSIASVLNERKSVLDFGAVDDAFVDSTEAFLKCPKGTYVPEGKFLVDSLKVDLQSFNGPGTIYTLGGYTMRLDNDPIRTHYVQRVTTEPRFGFDGRPAKPDTQIYPTAQFAPQGLALDRDPVTGEEFYFVSQDISGPTWGEHERLRIVKCVYAEDGKEREVVEFTDLIRCSHAHLSTFRENGQLYIYQSTQAPIGSGSNTTTAAGKGWSKLPWKGTATSENDIVNYNVWGAPGSGHRYEHYGKGCTQISQDGRYMVIIGINYSGAAGGRSLFVYGRLEVESAANPLDCEPVFASHKLRAMDNDTLTSYQGETCDGKYVYICWGSGDVYSRRGVSVYTMDGTKVKDLITDGPAGRYTVDQIRNGHPEFGWFLSCEPEGIVLRGNEIHVTYVDYWRKNSQIVTYLGQNFVNTGSTNVGRVPSTSQTFWRPTDVPATDGEWNRETTYKATQISRRSKVICAMVPRSGDPREFPLVSTFFYPYSVAVFASNMSEQIDFSVPQGQNLRFASHFAYNDTYRTIMQYGYGYTLDIRDSRDGSDNNLRGFVRTVATDADNRYVQIGAGDGTSANSAMIQILSGDSGVNAGSIRINTAVDSPDADVRLSVKGATKVATNATENVTYQTIRPIKDYTDAPEAPVDLGTIQRRFDTMRAKNFAVDTSTCIITGGTGTPEGVVATGPGSIFLSRGGSSNQPIWVKVTGLGNTGWRAL